MAANETILGFNTGVDFTYEAKNNKIYPVIVAQADQPIGKINVILWKKYYGKFITQYFSGNWT
jgi:hypothetical protein